QTRRTWSDWTRARQALPATAKRVEILMGSYACAGLRGSPECSVDGFIVLSNKYVRRLLCGLVKYRTHKRLRSRLTGAHFHESPVGSVSSRQAWLSSG